MIEQYSGAGRDFLLPPSGEGDKAIVDVSHEALFRNWDRLSGRKNGWLQEEAEARERWISLVNQAQLYRQDPQNKLRGAAFDQHEAWWKQKSPTPAWVRLSRQLPTRKANSEFDQVQDLMVVSRRLRERELLRKRMIGMAIPVALVLAVGYFAMSFSDKNATIAQQQDTLTCLGGQSIVASGVDPPAAGSDARLCGAILQRASGNETGADKYLDGVEREDLAKRISSAQIILSRLDPETVIAPSSRVELSNIPPLTTETYLEAIAENRGQARIELDVSGIVTIESYDLYLLADPTIQILSSNNEILASDDDGGEGNNFRIISYIPSTISNDQTGNIIILENVAAVGGFRVSARSFEFGKISEDNHDRLAIAFSIARSSIQTPKALTSDIVNLLEGVTYKDIPLKTIVSANAYLRRALEQLEDETVEETRPIILEIETALKLIDGDLDLLEDSARSSIGQNLNSEAWATFLGEIMTELPELSVTDDTQKTILELALTQSNFSLSMVPGHMNYLDTRGQLNRLLGNFHDAIEDFNRAIEAGGNYPGTYFSRAASLEAVGRFNEALEDYRQANAIIASRPSDEFLSRARSQITEGIERLSAHVDR